MFDFLFNTADFAIRSLCGPGWQKYSWLEYLHIISDVLIFLAYMIVPVFLVSVTWKNKESLGIYKKPIFRIVGLFGGFILFCGFGHLWETFTFVASPYVFIGFWKLGTAIVSVITAAFLPTIIPLIQNAIKYTKDHQNLQLFEEVFETSPIGMALVSPTGHWKRVNRQVPIILGYSAEELENGMTFQELTYPEDLNLDVGQAERIITGGIHNYDLIKRYIKKDESIVTAHIYVSGITNADGNFLYFVAQIEDITAQRLERAKTTQLIGEKDQQIAGLNRIVDQFEINLDKKVKDSFKQNQAKLEAVLEQLKEDDDE